MTIEEVGIVGAGAMGAGIAETVARAGCSVIMIDSLPGAVAGAVERIERSLGRAVERGKLTSGESAATLERISGGEQASLGTCQLIIECTAENIATKRTVFTMLDDTARVDAILVSNTSSLSITEIASSTRHPERVLGMHFFNPAPVMKLVEIVPGLRTNEHAISTVRDFAQQIGKTPVVADEGPGFLVNRMLVPMINEAVGIVSDGAATKEDIDAAMKLGANHPIGPLALADLIGTDVCLAIMDVLYAEFGDSKYRAHPLLRKMVRGGLLGRKSGHGFYNYNKEGNTP